MAQSNKSNLPATYTTHSIVVANVYVYVCLFVMCMRVLVRSCLSFTGGAA